MRENILWDFGNTIRFYRTGVHLSQKQLAEKTGFHQNYIGQIERGERNPSLINIQKFALAFEITLSELFQKYEEIIKLKPRSLKNESHYATSPNAKQKKKTTSGDSKKQRSIGKNEVKKDAALSAPSNDIKKDKVIPQVQYDLNIGRPVRVYNEKDLFILKGRLYQHIESTPNPRGNIIASLADKYSIKYIFNEFERIFHCKFDNVYKENLELFREIATYETEEEIRKYLPYVTILDYTVPLIPE